MAEMPLNIVSLCGTGMGIVSLLFVKVLHSPLALVSAYEMYGYMRADFKKRKNTSNILKNLFLLGVIPLF